MSFQITAKRALIGLAILGGIGVVYEIAKVITLASIAYHFVSRMW